MLTIYVENKPYQVEDGQNLLQACLSLGFNIPYFCWHPALNSVGACRQCAVKQFKDENDTQGKIIMSCMTPVADGMRISIDDADAKAFRANVIEWLMTNHPHDCPVCDEGGECHLQDMTVMSGHDYRRYRFEKRTYNNQKLGPFINHEMNRCIQCYRCVRFYCDYAGGTDFGVFGSHNHVYFGRHEDGTLESEFSGNLVEVCPTGVFTDKSFKQHFTRPWDLQTSPSVCVHCGLGCNVTPGERYGQLRRVRNRYNGAVNGYFLCDRGRYGYEFVNGAGRIREPRRSCGEAGSKADALSQLRQMLRETKMIGIGSPRASLESNFALRALVGADRFYMGIRKAELRLLRTMIDVMHAGPAPIASLRDAGEADAVFVIGEDVTNTAPLIALRLRQALRNQPLKIAAKLNIPAWNDAPAREAIQQAQGPLFQAVTHATKLNKCATYTYCAAPDDIARLALAVSHALDGRASAVPGLTEETRALAESIACTLSAAERPLIVSGASCGSESVVRAAGAIAGALARKGVAASLLLTVPECNSLGAALLCDRSFEDGLDGAEGAICVENDLFRRMDADGLAKRLESLQHFVVIDHSANETTARAELVLPAAAFAEGDGTFVNNEGRAQRFFQTYVPQGATAESWRWLGEIRAAAGIGTAWANHDEILAEFAKTLPAFAKVLEVAPPAAMRFAGQRLPRQQHRASGRTSMNAHINVSESRIGEDPDSPFTFSMEGYRGPVPSSVIPSFWSPGWNSVQSLNKFQEEVAGPLRGGDPGVRLITPGVGAANVAPADIPAEYAPRFPELLFVPVHGIYGSDEQSNVSAPVVERIPKPFVAVNCEDAAALGVAEGDAVEVALAGTIYKAVLAIRTELPHGVAGIQPGLPGMPFVGLPAWGTVVRGAGS